MTTDVLAQADTEFSLKVLIEVDATLARKRVDGRRVSQAWLAKRIGKSPVWLSDRMTGRVRLAVDDLALLAWGLDVKPGDLLPPIARYASLADMHLEHAPPPMRTLPIPVQRDPSQARPTALAMQRATDNLAASKAF